MQSTLAVLKEKIICWIQIAFIIIVKWPKDYLRTYLFPKFCKKKIMWNFSE